MILQIFVVMWRDLIRNICCLARILDSLHVILTFYYEVKTISIYSLLSILFIVWYSSNFHERCLYASNDLQIYGWWLTFMHLQLDLYSDLPARQHFEFINFALYLNVSQF